jgi:hypothetical protein
MGVIPKGGRIEQLTALEKLSVVNHFFAHSTTFFGIKDQYWSICPSTLDKPPHFSAQAMLVFEAGVFY